MTPFRQAVLVDCLAFGGAAAALLVAQQAGLLRLDPADATLTAVLVVGVLALRRVAPTATAVAVAAGIGATRGHLTAVDVAALAVAGYSLADSRLPARRSLWLLTAISGALGLWFYADGSAYAVGLTYLVSMPAWLLGAGRRERRERAVEARAAERAEQEARVGRAVAGERARLARDLHDTIAHDLGVVVVQAAGAREVLARDPARTLEALDAIEQTGRDALADLREALGLLDGGPDAAPRAPAPAGLERIEGLVGRLASAGAPVTLEVSGPRRDVPAPVAQAAARIVQEGLTNAMRYAQGSPTEVAVRFGEGELTVSVADGGGPAPAASAGSGRGLSWLRERTEAAGGTLEAGARDGGGFAVTARLPLPAGPPA